MALIPALVEKIMLHIHTLFLIGINLALTLTKVPFHRIPLAAVPFDLDHRFLTQLGSIEALYFKRPHMESLTNPVHYYLIIIRICQVHLHNSLLLQQTSSGSSTIWMAKILQPRTHQITLWTLSKPH